MAVPAPDPAGLGAWLGERLDEDQRLVAMVADAWWHIDVVDAPPGITKAIRSLTDPARVLAEVAAKREILRLWTHASERKQAPGLSDPEYWGRSATESTLWRAVLAMATAYRTTPGWRPEWATEVTA